MTEPIVQPPFDATHLYLQWGGKLPGGEQWSNGLRFASTDGSVVTPTDQNAMIGACVTALTAFHSGASFSHAGAKLSFVKLNAIDVDGTYAIDTTTQTVVADVGGGFSVPVYPNQVAIAVTLETGFSRGPAHRGRFYVPMPCIAVDANGVISTTNRDSLKEGVDTLLAALNAVRSDYKVAVFSRKRLAPSHRLVTGCHVGRVLDTQRRRRNKLVEAY
jgi:hypothetical protein